MPAPILSKRDVHLYKKNIQSDELASISFIYPAPKSLNIKSYWPKIE